MKPGRMWIPVDVNYWRDPQVVRAGEKAGVLFLAILGQVRLTGSEGDVTRAEVAALGISALPARLRALIDVGMLEEKPQGVLHVAAWEDWQGRSRAAYMREWRLKRAERDRS